MNFSKNERRVKNEKPKGVWKDYYTEKKYIGGEAIEIPVDIHSLPIFEKI